MVLLKNKTKQNKQTNMPKAVPEAKGLSHLTTLWSHTLSLKEVRAETQAGIEEPWRNVAHWFSLLRPLPPLPAHSQDHALLTVLVSPSPLA